MRLSRSMQLAAFLAVPWLGACQAGEAGEESPPAETASVALSPPPDTTAAALWAHLQQERYQENWALWPGKGRLYAGREPHGMLLTTYLNALALDALTNKAGSLSPGAIVVKENYTPDSTLAAVTVMYKASGYDAAHNDWFFLKRLADGTVEASGRVQGCQNCHRARAVNDYIYTGSLSAAGN